MIRLFYCLAVLAALVVPASADIVKNGQFEGVSGEYIAGVYIWHYIDYLGAYIDVTANVPDIPDWTVTAGSVDWIGTYWQAPPPGGQSVDLDGNSPGAISQDIITHPGQTYWLSFWLAGNPDGGDATKKLEVTVGGASHIFAFDTFGKSKADMGWTPLGISFTATGGSTTIAFASGDGNGSPYGPVIGDVEVRVPGPDFYTEFALSLSGLGLLMFVRRKRQT